MRPSHEQILREAGRIGAREHVLRCAFTGRTAVDAPPDKVAALVAAAAVLEQQRVSYMLVGGVAVGLHAGVPRATLDIDLAVPSSADREALVRAFCAAGFELRGRHEHSLNFRHSSGEPVQLAFDPLADPAIERALTFRTGPATIRLVRKDDLIAMKERAAGDPARRRSKALRDRADVEMLRGDVGDPDEGW